MSLYAQLEFEAFGGVKPLTDKKIPERKEELSFHERFATIALLQKINSIEFEDFSYSSLAKARYMYSH